MAERTSPRALSWLVLFAALAVSSVSLLSGDVLVRIAGLAVVAVGGVAACLLAWRTVQRTEELARTRSLDDLRRSGEKLHNERAQHLDVLRLLRRRNANLTSQLITLDRENATLLQQVSTLRGNNESLRVELELARTLETEAEVVTLPRRATGTTDAFSATDLWSQGNSPTVVDLQALVAPFVDDAVRHLA